MTKTRGKGNSLAKILIPSVSLLLLAPNPRLRRHGTILPLSPHILMYRPSGFPQSIEVQGNPLRYVQSALIRSTLRFVYRWQLHFLPSDSRKESWKLTTEGFERKYFGRDYTSSAADLDRIYCVSISFTFFSIFVSGLHLLLVLFWAFFASKVYAIRARVGPSRLFGINKERECTTCTKPGRRHEHGASKKWATVVIRHKHHLAGAGFARNAPNIPKRCMNS
jgi:hypothetical protein